MYNKTVRKKPAVKKESELAGPVYTGPVFVQAEEIIMREKTGAVLVAAGLSTRMHAFKPLLPFGDSTIAEHVVLSLKELGLDPIVVVIGYRGAELRQRLAYTGASFVVNERYKETQMFDSICLGIRAAAGQCERIAVMPMDLPAIRRETFERILDTDAQIARTSYNGLPGHPVVIRSQMALRLCEYSGTGGLKGAVEAAGIPYTELVTDDPGVRQDVDTREEYERLVEQYFSTESARKKETNGSGEKKTDGGGKET